MKLDPTVTHPLTLKGYKTFIDKHLKSDFDYSKAVYVNAKTPILIICNTCNKEFKSTPDSHKKAGCIHCSRKALGNSQKSNTAEFIKKAKSVHGNKYNYSLTEYNSNNTKVKIICPIHGEFKQFASLHLKGCGCPKCNIGTFNPLTKTILYYLKINYNEKVYYKIGITSKSITSRYTPAELSMISVLEEVEYSTGAEAYEMEQYLLNKYKNYSYKGPKILLAGNTEILMKDISIEFLNTKEINYERNSSND